MNSKIPSSGSSVSASSFVDSSLTPVTLPSWPRTSTGTRLHTISIFSFANARSWMHLVARSSSRLWIR